MGSISFYDDCNGEQLTMFVTTKDQGGVRFRLTDHTTPVVYDFYLTKAEREALKLYLDKD